MLNMSAPASEVTSKINSTENNAKSSPTPSRTRVEMTEVEDHLFFQFILMGGMKNCIFTFTRWNVEDL